MGEGQCGRFRGSIPPPPLGERRRGKVHCLSELEGRARSLRAQASVASPLRYRLNPGLHRLNLDRIPNLADQNKPLKTIPSSSTYGSRSRLLAGRGAEPVQRCDDPPREIQEAGDGASGGRSRRMETSSSDARGACGTQSRPNDLWIMEMGPRSGESACLNAFCFHWTGRATGRA